MGKAKYKFDPSDPRCQATAKSTERRCGNSAVPGSPVCETHGGASPQAQRKAAERLADLRDAAAEKLALRISKTTATQGVDDKVLLDATVKLTELTETLEGRSGKSVRVSGFDDLREAVLGQAEEGAASRRPATKSKVDPGNREGGRKRKGKAA